MNIYKSMRRDTKINKRKNGHQVDNRNIFIIEGEKRKRAEAIQRKREEKEKELFRSD